MQRPLTSDQLGWRDHWVLQHDGAGGQISHPAVVSSTIPRIPEQVTLGYRNERWPELACLSTRAEAGSGAWRR